MSLEVSLQLERGDFRLDVDFRVDEPGITALFGPSGCGKTSLLRTIAGLERGARGRVVVDGAVWQDAKRFVPVHHRALGFVFQEASLFPHLSVEGNLRYGWKRVPESERRIRLEEIIELLDLGPLLGRRPQGLSGGERQRVAVGRALATSPRLLLMDEPLAALDARRKAEILPFLERLHRSLALPILYVTHSAEEVARLADRVLLMADGRITHEGSVTELLPRITREGEGPLSLLHGRVLGHLEEDALLEVEAAGHRLLLPSPALTAGTPVRLRIPAREVSLALDETARSSILNRLPARIEWIEEEGPGTCLVHLSVSGHELLARVTRRSVRALDLAPGRAVVAQIKSVALEPVTDSFRAQAGDWSTT
ncbi:MAG: molybdenum ABC transporter ATP-binding protein [Gammaproteobacteria bacterium]|nr:MAG: molybdenum ABC transporter ATP-binding protein [Gammaproteobacteria bacterium]